MRAELRDWDLWGPFFLCMSLAVLLSLFAHDEASIVFSVIFVIVWVGAAVITVNGQLLGGKMYVSSLHLCISQLFILPSLPTKITNIVAKYLSSDGHLFCIPTLIVQTIHTNC